MPPNSGTTAQSPVARSEIARFFAGKNVFITGASGFIGKVLVEKLLRSCPDLGKVYILLRTKNGLSPEQRLEQQFVGCKVFSGIASLLVQDKVRPLDGELHNEYLGLDEKSQQLLIESVDVVFHVAASVRFDDPLRQCMRENVEGTKHVLDLCHRMTQLKALVHVSTAYAYCHLNESEERLYPMKVQPHQLLDLCTWMDDKSLEVGCAKLFEGRPNTYTFTKAVAEHYVDQNRGTLPVAIARPSIVTASKKEPFAGWVDSINGPGGVSLLGTLGIARTMKCKPSCKADLIPVDTVANALVAIAWQTARCPPPAATMPVYNITTGNLNPTTWEMFLEYGRDIAIEKPSIRMVRVPVSVPRGDSVNKFGHYLTRFFSETLFAYVMDFLIILFGHKPLMVRLVRRMHNAFQMLEYFATRQWKFPSDNLVALNKSLNETDRKVFDFDVTKIDWNVYTHNMYLGMRRHLLKEDDDNVEKARKRFTRIKLTYGVLNALFILLLLYVCSRFVPINYFNMINIRSN